MKFVVDENVSQPSGPKNKGLPTVATGIPNAVFAKLIAGLRARKITREAGS